MNTLHHTQKRKKLSSQALMRHDQEARGHFRLGGKYAKPSTDDAGTGPRPIAHFGDYGTIGAKLTRPER